MKSAFTKLLSIKKIIALMLTLIFCYLSIIGKVEPKDFLTIFIMIISFYFGQSTANGSKIAQTDIKE